MSNKNATEKFTLCRENDTESQCATCISKIVGKGSIFSPPAKNIGKSQIGIKVTQDVLAGRSVPRISHWAESKDDVRHLCETGGLLKPYVS